MIVLIPFIFFEYPRLQNIEYCKQKPDDKICENKANFESGIPPWLTVTVISMYRCQHLPLIIIDSVIISKINAFVKKQDGLRGYQKAIRDL